LFHLFYLYLGTCLYIGSTGDNKAWDNGGTATSISGTEHRAIYKIVEPSFINLVKGSLVTDYQSTSVSNPSKYVWIYKYTFPSTPKQYVAVDAMFVDWSGDSAGGVAGDIYLVSSWKEARIADTRLYNYPVASQSTSSTYTLSIVAGNVNL
jgi:hypothetical protein